jgi:hypothetical protein
MRKQGVHAGLSLRRIEDELCLSVLLQHGVVMVDRHRSVRIPAGGRADPKNCVIQPVRESGGPDHHKNCANENLSQPHSQVRDRGLSHEARL